jgi:hypothetical protein
LGHLEASDSFNSDVIFDQELGCASPFTVVTVTEMEVYTIATVGIYLMIIRGLDGYGIEAFKITI